MFLTKLRNRDATVKDKSARPAETIAVSARGLPALRSGLPQLHICDSKQHQKHQVSNRPRLPHPGNSTAEPVRRSGFHPASNGRNPTQYNLLPQKQTDHQSASWLIVICTTAGRTRSRSTTENVRNNIYSIANADMTVAIRVSRANWMWH